MFAWFKKAFPLHGSLKLHLHQIIYFILKSVKLALFSPEKTRFKLLIFQIVKNNVSQLPRQTSNQSNILYINICFMNFGFVAYVPLQAERLSASVNSSGPDLHFWLQVPDPHSGLMYPAKHIRSKLLTLECTVDFNDPKQKCTERVWYGLPLFFLS